jgi:hypothetical protein
LEICDQVLAQLIGLGESIPSIIATYFRTIDVWLPVISQSRIQKAFRNLSAAPSTDLGALLLCMYLITRVPGQDPGTMACSVYLRAKSLYSCQASMGKGSVEIVQAGLLLALYEQGHGLLEAAQMSMAMTWRLGRRMVVASKRAGLGIFDTELGNLWWGVLVLDR